MRDFLITFLLLMSFAAISFGQDGPMNAAPGQPPPPQGWDLSPNPKAGIRIPEKKKKKLKLQMHPVDEPAATPKSSPASKK